VFNSACIGRGASSDVIAACLARRVQPCMSTALLNEYRDVLSRNALFVNSRLDNRERGLMLRAFLSR
jgi:predicted nucleic acid-binding protein